MKKIVLFCSLFLVGLFLVFNGYNAYAEGTIVGGVQTGKQTQEMTIDEGLKILDLNPSDFKYKEVIKCDLTTDLITYFGYNGIKDKTPIEVLGITESYEFTNTSGFIDTYIYLYSPYALDIYGELIPFTTYYDSCALKLGLNENRMVTEEDNGLLTQNYSYWLGVKNHYADMDSVMQEFETTLVRANVKSEDEVDSISEGVTRLRFRVYTHEDIKVDRQYYVEKVVYSYDNIVDEKSISSNCTPSFNARFSAVKEDGSVDTDKEYDEEFTDTNIFQVKNRSVVCVEVNNYIFNKHYWFGLNKTRVYILLRNKETGELIDNCTSMQIIYKLKKDKPEDKYRTVKKDNVGLTDKFKISNVLSTSGQFGTCTDELLDDFKTKLIPEIEGGYNFEELPQYIWGWNYEVKECQTIYVWYEVEKDTIVKGSAYENGLHVEYDENGKSLGVYDKDGKKVEGVEYDSETGVILNDDGTTRLPENSYTELNYEEEIGVLDTLPDILPDIDKSKLNLFDKLILWFKNVVKPFFVNNKWYFIIGASALILGIFFYKYKKKE